jgi:hypothetical protein
MVDPACVKVSVFLLCSGSGDAYAASASLSHAEAEKAAARTVATLLAKSPDAVDPSQWRRELDTLNRLYAASGSHSSTCRSCLMNCRLAPKRCSGSMGFHGPSGCSGDGSPNRPLQMLPQSRSPKIGFLHRPFSRRGDGWDRGDHEGKCSFQRRRAGVTGVTGIESWIGPVTPGPLLRHTLRAHFPSQSHLSPLSHPRNGLGQRGYQICS